MTTRTDDLRKSIVRVCHRLGVKNWIAAADGNVSIKENDNRILITPSGVNKSFLTEDAVTIMDSEGVAIEGNPSGERWMHLKVYQSCPQAKAVVHAHPPTCIAWSIARPEWAELPLTSLSEGLLALGRVPIAPYARPGSPDMGRSIEPFLTDSRALILARHGVLTWGETIEEAYDGIERLEAIAKILWTAAQLGPLSQLPDSELEYLRALRSKLGPKIL